MYLLYSFLLAIGFALLLPKFIIDAVRHGKYLAGLAQRLGFIEQMNDAGRPVIWLHCVSVGETKAGIPLIHAILKKYPSFRIVVSTVTLTGQNVARVNLTDHAVTVIYFPLDWAFTVRRALRQINPFAVLIMETELWPRFLHECSKLNIPVSIVNGRISASSFKNYLRVKYFTKRIVGNLSLAIMQTKEDAARIHDLGLPSERIRISGNIKFDAEEEVSANGLTASLRERFSFGDDPSLQPLIVAASTHRPEEEQIINAFKLICQRHPNFNARLVIAPRHPERFAEVGRLIESSGRSWTRRLQAASETDRMAQVILLDSIGELSAIYSVATIVFIGGSLVKVGGHNLIEPALASKPIITGPFMFNFADITEAFVQADAIIKLSLAAEQNPVEYLYEAFAGLLQNGTRREELVNNSLQVLAAGRGATERTLQFLTPIFLSVSPGPVAAITGSADSAGG